MAGHTAFETLSYRVADNGVAFVTIDVPGRKLNVLTPELHREIGEVARLLASDDSAAGAVVHSGKSSFLAGGDLKRIVAYYDMGRSAAEAFEQSRTYTDSLRALETCGKPVAVAVNGSALGGGLELALACHHRVVVDDPEIRLGLPEVTLGLIPGGGGTQRLPRLVGIGRAADLILTGRSLKPGEALEAGVVDEIAPAGELLQRAERWVLEDGVAEQPWDRKGFQLPGGSGISDLRIGGLFLQLTMQVSAEHRHNYPAPIAALRCLFNGTTVRSMDAALEVETREFSALTRDPVARNIIRTLFIHRGQRRKAEKAAPDAYQARDAAIAEMVTAAYAAEGRRMLEEGAGPALIRNAALAVGMAEGPGGLETAGTGTGTAGVDAGTIGVRLLCAQALPVAEGWAEGSLDPVDADLASVCQAGFPTYTGGVMSYIDTLGVGEFVTRCDRLADDFGEHFRPSDRLRGQAAESGRVYPQEA